jgi:hypothetical protein
MDAIAEANEYFQEHELADAALPIKDQIIAAFAAGWNMAIEVAAAAHAAEG